MNSHPSSVFSLFHLRQALTLWPWLSWLWLGKPGVLRLTFACVYLSRSKGLGHHTWLSLLLSSITAVLHICSTRRQKGLVFATEPVVHGGLHQSEIQEGWVMLLALPPIDLQMRKEAQGCGCFPGHTVNRQCLSITGIWVDWGDVCVLGCSTCSSHLSGYREGVELPSQIICAGDRSLVFLLLSASHLKFTDVGSAALLQQRLPQTANGH